MRRFLIDPNVAQGAIVPLSGGDSHHLVQVLRLKVGDAVQLFDGRGVAYPGRVTAIDAAGARVEVGRARPTAAESPPMAKPVTAAAC
jgi:16S rRNA (uracil1498-N3)-methyltransferase